MIIIAPLVMMTATTVVAPSVQEPPPLLDITTLPNSSAVRKRTMTASALDVYQYVLAVSNASPRTL
jgi:hypothetical protein